MLKEHIQSITDFDRLAGKEKVNKLINELSERNVEAVFEDSGIKALDRIKEWVPSGASVMNGASHTLKQIGYIDYLKSGLHPWKNLHEIILEESDPSERKRMRPEAELSDYYLGSVHAITEAGEFIIASNTGSQLPHIVYTSPNLIFVVSTKKIVGSLREAFDRLCDHVVPQEDHAIRARYGEGTAANKIVIFNGEYQGSGRMIRMILVNEDLGY